MTASSRALSATPELRTGFYYSTTFASGGVAGAYFAIWLSGKGISAADTGVINSVPVFLMLAINIFVGRLADRADDWRSVIIIGSLISGVMSFGLFFVNEFWGILLFWTLTAIPFAAVAPVIDAAAVRMTRRNGTEFGVVRAWGTLGYMSALAATGYFVVWFGPGVFVPLFVIVSVLRGVASLQLPKFRASERHKKTAEEKHVAKQSSELWKPWFLLPVVGFALLFSTLLMLNVFAALVWKSAGISEPIIGTLLAAGALSEAVIMFVFRQFSTRFTARHLILFAAVVTAIRWAAMALNPPVWVLFLLQSLHGISFGIGYMGLVNFIANWTSEDMAAEAQSVSFVLQQAFSVVALAGFGYLFQLLGIQAFFVAGGFCLVGAFLIWWSILLKNTKSEKENGPA